MQWAGLRSSEIPELFRFLFLGIVPVYGFMVLSGFVIAHLVTISRESYLPYIVRRYFRLIPVAIVGMLCAFTINKFIRPVNFWPKEDLLQYSSLYLILLHGLVPNEILAHASKKFVGPGWSISLEWQFYLIAPFLVKAISRGRKWLLPVIAIVAFSFFIGFAQDDRIIHLFGKVFTYDKPSILLSVVVYFIIGIFIYRFRQFGIKYSIEVAILVFLISLFFQPLNERPMLWQITPLLTVIVFILLNDGSKVVRLFENPILCWLGRISYSTYMLHFFVVSVSTFIFAPIVGRGWPLFWTLLVVVPPVTVAVSAASYYYVEKPFIRVARLIAKKL